MANNNINLQNAKDLRDDEFYTTYESIEEELAHYSSHFLGKTILCNCDDPFESNFCKYFIANFARLGLKRLICTSYKGSKVISTKYKLLDANNRRLSRKHGYVLDIKDEIVPCKELALESIETWLLENKPIRKLKGDGDFLSDECLAYLHQADIIVTNPPFSKFKEMVSVLVAANKKYLLVGNQNSLTYKEIFPLIQQNLAWTGYRFGDMKFRVPADSTPRKTRFWIDESGQKWRSLGNAMWLTNLDIDKKHQWLPLVKKYSPEEYPTYDNYPAINVKRVVDIPADYPGIMGVPITILGKYNPDQFEIVGEANHGSDNEFDLFKPLVNGKLLFKRILIRLKKNQNEEETYV